MSKWLLYTSALSGAAASPAGAGTRSTTTSSNSTTPWPVLPLTRMTSAGSVITACSISAMTNSGRAWARSILLSVGMMVRPASMARKAFATVCACTPWKASASSTAPSHAASERDTS